MKNLIQNYENEILMAKDAVNRFKENPIAFQSAQARLSTYERVLSDLKNKKCSTCNFFNIKSAEHGICDNPENDFSLRFNASKKGFEMLKDDVKLIDFINEVEPYTTFYIHQDFGCINHCL